MPNFLAASGEMLGRALRIALLPTLLIGTVAAHAEDWPTRPIRVISPYPAGSASDTVSRVVLDEVSQLLGKPFVIEMRPGAGGSLGFGIVAHAPPDGYTLVTSSSSMATESVLHRTMPYDPVRDFTHVVLLGTSPNVIVASKKSGFKTLGDLIAAAKAKPGTLTFASAGIGSSSHMAGERLRLAAKIDVRHVPFREGGLLEVMAGRIDFYCIPLAAAASALKNPNLVVLAVTADKRSPLLPSVPSVTEAGYPGAVFRFWNGISAPAKTPPEVVQKLHDVTEKALAMPVVRERLAKLGVEPANLSTAAFGKFFKEDYDATRQLAKDADIHPLD
ncbi:MAG TPA: tripartite tricarboxylate transporter substrate binding protein [Pseudolabrys sp.]|jgi:tripartite-type tricarboxylate transporter receptor subunit TctC|nr:tripartite tricarboxylate transporter substrate binding protein [Pseudolabrys sp.]